MNPKHSENSQPAAEPAAGGVDDAGLVDRLTESILAEPRTRHLLKTHLPDRDAVSELVEDLRDLMFPGFYRRRGLTSENLRLHVQELVARIHLAVEQQVRAVLRYVKHIDTDAADNPDSQECDRTAKECADTFMEELPEIRRMLALDVQAAFDGDPAALHTDETIFCYPGVDAIFSHRVAHALYRLRVPLLPRIIQELSHSRTGIDIHPGARIGESFFVDHGAGVVIGQTSEIGRYVRIYQGVTIGATSFELDSNGQLKRTGDTKRHPTIGDRVTIYAGAVILGGETMIGDDCVIAGSVFVTESVPPGCLVRQEKPELVLRSVQSR
jgi:serine O-acetyltransferase